VGVAGGLEVILMLFWEHSDGGGGLILLEMGGFTLCYLNQSVFLLMHMIII
jgi:hypothetical protein